MGDAVWRCSSLGRYDDFVASPRRRRVPSTVGDRTPDGAIRTWRRGRAVTAPSSPSCRVDRPRGSRPHPASVDPSPGCAARRRHRRPRLASAPGSHDRLRVALRSSATSAVRSLTSPTPTGLPRSRLIASTTSWPARSGSARAARGVPSRLLDLVRGHLATWPPSGRPRADRPVARRDGPVARHLAARPAERLLRRCRRAGDSPAPTDTGFFAP